MQLDLLRSYKRGFIGLGIACLIVSVIFTLAVWNQQEGFSNPPIYLGIILFVCGVYALLRGLMTRQSEYVEAQQALLDEVEKNKARRRPFVGIIDVDLIAMGIQTVFWLGMPLLFLFGDRFADTFFTVGILLMFGFVLTPDFTQRFYVRDNAIHRRSILFPWRNSVWPMQDFVYFVCGTYRRGGSYLRLTNNSDKTLVLNEYYYWEDLYDWCRENLVDRSELLGGLPPRKNK